MKLRKQRALHSEAKVAPPSELNSVTNGGAKNIAGNKPDIEEKILAFGQEVFARISKSQPGLLDKGYFNSKMMQWTFTQPQIKAQLFQLVDVLPSLKGRRSIAAHIDQYLRPGFSSLHKLLGYSLDSLKLGIVPQSIAQLTVRQSVKQMAGTFIAGTTAEEAAPELEKLLGQGQTFTVDLLGEYSLSETEADDYLHRYLTALRALGTNTQKWQELFCAKKPASISESHPGLRRLINISVKLSALYSKISVLNFEQSVAVLSERLVRIIDLAEELDAGVYFDAEDSAYNPIVYATFKKVFGELRPNYKLPGLVIQAYSKDSGALLKEFASFARQHDKQLAVRLVKGAYWDSETASAAQNYLDNPLYTDKAASDLNFELLSRYLLDHLTEFYPAFGSHNVRSLAHACVYAKEKEISQDQFEVQMLYGMAAPIAAAFTQKGYLVRMYVPLGELIPGMSYLVRRLLENTSNDSFLKHTFYDKKQEKILLQKPVMALATNSEQKPPAMVTS